jgi:hypothetical protein
MAMPNRSLICGGPSLLMASFHPVLIFSEDKKEADEELADHLNRATHPIQARITSDED